MRTLNQKIALIQSLKENHGQLNSGTFYFGDPWEYGQTQQLSYPFTGLRLLGSSIDGNILTTNFNIFFCDRVKKGELNETEVLSDMNLIALDFFSQLRFELNNNDPLIEAPAEIVMSSQLTPFTERFPDEVSGVEMNFGIVEFYDRQTCDIPT